MVSSQRWGAQGSSRRPGARCSLDGFEHRSFGRADVLGLVTPGPERASRTAASIGVGTSPVSTIRSRSTPGSGTGTADSKAFVYGWAGAEYTSAGRPLLDDRAEVHHGQPVRHLPYDGQVVGDQHVRQAELVAKVGEQVQHLRLDGHVERGHRLVADQQIGLHRQRPRDPDPLPLTAGELVRIALEVLLGQPDLLAAARRAAPGSAGSPARGTAYSGWCRPTAAGSATPAGPGRPSGSCAGPAGACGRGPW